MGMIIDGSANTIQYTSGTGIAIKNMTIDSHLVPEIVYSRNGNEYAVSNSKGLILK